MVKLIGYESQREGKLITSTHKADNFTNKIIMHEENKLNHIVAPRKTNTPGTQSPWKATKPKLGMRDETKVSERRMTDFKIIEKKEITPNLDIARIHFALKHLPEPTPDTSFI